MKRIPRKRVNCLTISQIPRFLVGERKEKETEAVLGFKTKTEKSGHKVKRPSKENQTPPL